MPIPGLSPDQTSPQTPPNAAAILGSAQNAQASPNAPAPQAPVINPQAPQAPQAMPFNPALAHNARTGAAFHALMGNHGVAGPDGTVTQVPNKPGDLFRSILAGAITGMASGAQAKMGGGIGSFAVGAGGAQQQQEFQKEKLQQQSQQQFQNQQEQEKEAQQQLYQHAQIANMQAETAVRQHMTDLQDKEYHDKHNEASQAMITGLTAAGGVAPIDGKIPDSLTVPDLVKAYTKDPSVRQAPSGYMRHFIDTTDSSELSFNGTNWVHADGTPANMTDHSSVKVIDVPNNAMTTKRPMSGKDLNKISGQDMFEPDKTYQVAPLDMDSMNTNRLKNENETARTHAAERQAKIGERANQLEADRQLHAGFDAQRTAIAAKKESLQTELKGLQNDLSATPADKADLSAQIAAQDQALQDLADQEYPRKGKGKVAPKTEGTPVAPVTFVNPQGQQVVATTQEQIDKAVKLGYKKAGQPVPATSPVALNPMGRAVVSGVQSAVPVVQTAISALP